MSRVIFCHIDVATGGGDLLLWNIGSSIRNFGCTFAVQIIERHYSLWFQFNSVLTSTSTYDTELATMIGSERLRIKWNKERLLTAINSAEVCRILAFVQMKIYSEHCMEWTIIGRSWLHLRFWRKRQGRIRWWFDRGRWGRWWWRRRRQSDGDPTQHADIEPGLVRSESIGRRVGGGQIGKGWVKEGKPTTKKFTIFQGRF